MFLKLRMEREAGKEEAGKVEEEGEVARSSAGYSIKDSGEREGTARSGMWTRPWREEVVEGRRRSRRSGKRRYGFIVGGSSSVLSSMAIHG